jgi:hypothetical protein
VRRQVQEARRELHALDPHLRDLRMRAGHGHRRQRPSPGRGSPSTTTRRRHAREVGFRYYHEQSTAQWGQVEIRGRPPLAAGELMKVQHE